MLELLIAIPISLATWLWVAGLMGGHKSSVPVPSDQVLGSDYWLGCSEFQPFWSPSDRRWTS